MRIVATIPHPHCKISIFSYNEKWIIEIEGGAYKQTYRISQESMPGLDDVKSLVTTRLLDGSMERFGGMHADFREAFEQWKQRT